MFLPLLLRLRSLLSAPAALAARIDALASRAGPELLRPALRVALAARELRLEAAAASAHASPASSLSSFSPSGPGRRNGTATSSAVGRRGSNSLSSLESRLDSGDDGENGDGAAAAAARAAVAAALASADGDDELARALGPGGRPSSFFEAARAELSAVLSAAAAAAGGGGGAGGGSGGSGGGTSPPAPAPPLLRCPLDPTLPPSAASAGGPVLVAADVSNAELVAPHLVVQAAHLLALLPRGDAFLSVYESGSSATDATRDWLLLAEALARALGAPSRVVRGGRLERRPGQNRIEFLAEARNRALQPLWSEEGVRGEVLEEEREEEGDDEFVPPRPSAPFAANGSSTVSSSRQNQQQQSAVASSRRAARVAAASGGTNDVDDEEEASSSSSSSSSGSSSGAGGGWPASRVLFLNDVFFCASDALRLLSHVDPSAGPDAGKADLSCGLDFDRPRLQDAPLDEQVRISFFRSFFFFPRKLFSHPDTHKKYRSSSGPRGSRGGGALSRPSSCLCRGRC